jgi:hypothetical protein
MVGTVVVKALGVGGMLLTLGYQVELILHVLHCGHIRQVPFLCI